MDKDTFKLLTLKFIEIVDQKLVIKQVNSSQDLINTLEMYRSIKRIEDLNEIILFPTNNCFTLSFLFYIYLKEYIPNQEMEFIATTRIDKGQVRFHIDLKIDEFLFSPVESYKIEITNKNLEFKKDEGNPFRSSDLSEFLNYTKTVINSPYFKKSLDFICRVKKAKFKKLKFNGYDFI